MRVFCLSTHAHYRCQHSGACCTSGWPIPVEARLRRRLDDALASGRLWPAQDEPLHSAGHQPSRISAFLDEGDMPAGMRGILRTDPGGACWFYDRQRRRCAVHSRLGHDALPVSCQHFPRVCLLDRDGTFVTLSHYCPTAADLLFGSDAGLEVVAAPPRFAPMALEGLDARDALPPLLHPGILMDRGSYRAWERKVVALLANAQASEPGLLEAIDATERLRTWRPPGGPLAQAVTEAFVGTRHEGEPSGGEGGSRPSRERDAAPTLNQAALALDRLVRDCVPRGLTASAAPVGAGGRFERLVAPAWPAFAGPVKRYLAARTFANWCAYQGRGLRTVLCSVVAALCVLKVESARRCAEAGRMLDASLLKEAIRSADLLLVHLASREELARTLGEVEDRPVEEITRALK